MDTIIALMKKILKLLLFTGKARALPFYFLFPYVKHKEKPIAILPKLCYHIIVPKEHTNYILKGVYTMFSAYYAPATVSKGYFVDSALRSTSRRLLKYLGCVNIQISKVEGNRFYLSFTAPNYPETLSKIELVLAAYV